MARDDGVGGAVGKLPVAEPRDVERGARVEQVRLGAVLEPHAHVDVQRDGLGDALLCRGGQSHPARELAVGAGAADREARRIGRPGRVARRQAEVVQQARDVEDLVVRSETLLHAQDAAPAVRAQAVVDEPRRRDLAADGLGGPRRAHVGRLDVARVERGVPLGAEAELPPDLRRQDGYLQRDRVREEADALGPAEPPARRRRPRERADHRHAQASFRGFRGTLCSQSARMARNAAANASGWSRMRWWYACGMATMGALRARSSYMYSAVSGGTRYDS